MLLKKGLGSKKSQLLTITLVPLVFGALAFLYSFFGLLQHVTTHNFQFQPFQVPTVQEIEGHFLFGYAAALFSRNVKIGVMTGLMALTIDIDHLLSAVGLEIETRLAHSIPFAIMSCILIGVFVSRFFKSSSTTRPDRTPSISREAAKIQGLHFNTNKADTSSWFSSRRLGEKYSGYKVLVEENTDRILGAHVLGHHVEEVINILAIAIRLGIKAGDIKQAIFAYPTNSSDIAYML